MLYKVAKHPAFPLPPPHEPLSCWVVQIGLFSQLYGLLPKP